MDLRTPAIVCAARTHGETGVILRVLSEDYGLIASYVAGGRGRTQRPVLLPGNLVAAELRARPGSQLPSARVELVASRGPWLTEPLPAAAITWATTLAAAALPEQQPYPALYQALVALLDAICHAPSARGWLPGMTAFEALLLRELGYGEVERSFDPDWNAQLASFDKLGPLVARYPLADRRSDVMAARAMLRERLGRID